MHFFKETAHFLVRRILFFKSVLNIRFFSNNKITKVNLCSGTEKISGFFNLDIALSSDLVIDLSKQNLPFPENSMDVVICISAINYFTYDRAGEIIKEVHRVLAPGGIARFGVQDLEAIAEKYVNKDTDFFFQKTPHKQDRFEGQTLGDKFVAWFYGYRSGKGNCRYFYDYNSLAVHFKETGFSQVERKEFRESRLKDITQIDNRAGQMFFLEAIK